MKLSAQKIPAFNYLHILGGVNLSSVENSETWIVNKRQ